ADTIVRDENKIQSFDSKNKTVVQDILKIDRVDNVFLRFDAELDDKKRFIEYIHEEKLKRFRKASLFSVDATFKTTHVCIIKFLLCTRFCCKKHIVLYTVKPLRVVTSKI
ncbi:hypothetical protein CDIK_4271, partial [Cucumispora dikerogammari]